jgi:hypothetical protein
MTEIVSTTPSHNNPEPATLIRYHDRTPAPSSSASFLQQTAAFFLADQPRRGGRQSVPGAHAAAYEDSTEVLDATPGSRGGTLSDAKRNSESNLGV